MQYLINSLLAGIGVSLIAGPLGSIMIWQRMVYFGETLAHATLLGICISLFFKLNIYVGLFLVCSFVAISLVFIRRQKKIANDAILGILAHSLLAVGLILASQFTNQRFDLLSYLQGDILAIDSNDLYWIYGVAFLSLSILYKFWNEILSTIVHEDLAYVDGVNVTLVRWLIVVLMSLVFAVAMQLIGILLLTSLFIIPASAARQISKSPEGMLLLTTVFGVVSVIFGVYSSYFFDIPTGPAIVVISSIIFVLTLLFNTIKSYMHRFMYTAS